MTILFSICGIELFKSDAAVQIFKEILQHLLTDACASVRPTGPSPSSD